MNKWYIWTALMLVLLTATSAGLIYQHADKKVQKFASILNDSYPLIGFAWNGWSGDKLVFVYKSTYGYCTWSISPWGRLRESTKDLNYLEF